MYGIVNRAVESLVLQAAGENAWREITEAAGFSELELVDSENYSDEVTVKIAMEICSYLHLELDVLLHMLGKHWVVYTQTQGWHQHFKLSGNSLIEVLQDLDSLHARVRDAMPDGSMPAFAVSTIEEGYILEYKSSRDGFAPMVLGILEGLAESFNEMWHFELVDKKAQCGVDRFLLKSESVLTAHGGISKAA